METWWFLALEFAVAITLIVMSKRQPFPGPSKRYGNILLVIALLFLIGETSPRETDVQAHLFFLLIYGSLGLVRGVQNMLVNRDEVIVAPFAGFLFSISATAMMAEQWGSLSVVEEYAAFGTIVLLGGGQTWLVFRGLLIGRLPLAWSKAGLVALQRGQISGEHGAIECFEKSWDLEEEHLNPMAWTALEKIQTFLGNESESEHWKKRLAESGGQDAVAKEWLEAIDSALNKINPKEEE
ncbi:MAG: hypothetical protein L7S49_03740 [Candidatus Poseidoniaceae archaeon]|nr:hypothetical protein [Euryarchaeota archaeon]MCH1527307.1 hypothetical protein [Candidatus Poseidoniaceae archaeon]|tara:strand:+ start:171 stop:887 length:717 start_codon:yes stop_codon:yes gene_type:complete